MLIYESDKCNVNWDSGSNWRQSLKRTTSSFPTPIAQQHPPPAKRLKLTPSNKSLLRQLGVKVLEQ